MQGTQAQVHSLVHPPFFALRTIPPSYTSYHPDHAIFFIPTLPAPHLLPIYFFPSPSLFSFSANFAVSCCNSPIVFFASLTSPRSALTYHPPKRQSQPHIPKCLQIPKPFSLPLADVRWRSLPLAGYRDNTHNTLGITRQLIRPFAPMPLLVLQLVLLLLLDFRGAGGLVFIYAGTYPPPLAKVLALRDIGVGEEGLNGGVRKALSLPTPSTLAVENDRADAAGPREDRRARRADMIACRSSKPKDGRRPEGSSRPGVKGSVCQSVCRCSIAEIQRKKGQAQCQVRSPDLRRSSAMKSGTTSTGYTS